MNTDPRDNSPESSDFDPGSPPDRTTPHGAGLPGASRGSGAIEDLVIDPDMDLDSERTSIASVDPRLAAALGRLAEPELPPGLVDRVYATSVAMLPMPVASKPGGLRLVRATDARYAPGRWLRSWAPRLAMAAAIGLALVVANPFSAFLQRADRVDPAVAVFVPTLLADGGSLAEPVLIALLCDVDGRACWLDFDAALGTSGNGLIGSAGDDVDSLLLTRGARFDDLAAEFGRIVRSAPTGTRP